MKKATILFAIALLFMFAIVASPWLLLHLLPPQLDHRWLSFDVSEDGRYVVFTGSGKGGRSVSFRPGK